MSAFTPSNIPASGASVSAMAAMADAYNQLNSRLNRHINEETAALNVHNIKDYVGDTSVLDPGLNASTLVAGVNKVHTEAVSNANALSTLSGTVSDNYDTLDSKIDSVDDNVTAADSHIGDLSTLTTTAKSSAVAAINELDNDLSSAEGHIGNLSSLTTTDKSSTVSAINEINGRVDDNTNAITALNSNPVNTKFDGTVICKDYSVVFDDQLASAAWYVGAGRYAIAEICVTDDENRFTKEAVALVKHVNTKPFDAIVTMTVTEDDTPNASLIVQISKASSDWTDLEFAILKTTDGEHKVHYILTLKSASITPYGGVNTDAEPGNAQNDNVNLALRVSGVNIIPLGKSHDFPACNDDNVIISRVIGEGTQYVTLDGLTVRGYPLANTNDIQIATEGVPTGTIIRWGAWTGATPNNPPTGYVPCNGAIITSSMPEWEDYAKLRDAYGYPAGATTMTLPDEENSLVKIS